MGYSLEFRAANLETISAELTNPQITGEELAARNDFEYLDPDVVAAWPSLQQRVVEAANSGQTFTAGPDIASYIAIVIQQKSYGWHAIQHSSSGGEEFRQDLTTIVAPLLGTKFTAGLVSRPILGISADDHPLFGWATIAEISQALAKATEQGIPPLYEQTEDVRTILTCANAAIQRNLDLVTLYL